MQICTLVWNSGPVCPRNFNENKQRWPTLAHQLFPDNRWLLQDFIFALGQSLIFITQVWRRIYLSNFCSYRIDPNKIWTVRTCPMCRSGFVAEMKRKSISAVHFLLFSSLHNTLLHKAYFSGKKKGGGEEKDGKNNIVLIVSQFSVSRWQQRVKQSKVSLKPCDKANQNKHPKNKEIKGEVADCGESRWLFKITAKFGMPSATIALVTKYSC